MAAPSERKAKCKIGSYMSVKNIINFALFLTTFSLTLADVSDRCLAGSSQGLSGTQTVMWELYENAKESDLYHNI